MIRSSIHAHAAVQKVTQDQQGTRRVTYQFEFVRCGKSGCQCADDRKRHGPYWFAYWKHVGVRRKRYIGMTLKFLSFEQLRATERSDTRKETRRKRKAAAAAHVEQVTE